MINNPFPNRAEINDIYNTLIDGVDGLVLAAETAVGKYPVESASIIKRIFKSFKTSFKNKKSSDTVYTIKKFDEIIIDKFAESDVKQIVFGTYKPLDRFMSLTEIKSVLNKNRLLDGNIWTLPIVLPINRKIKINKYYNILNSKKKILCSIKVDSLFEIDSKELLKKWFSTDYLNHPGIKSLKSRGEYFISGKITSPQFNNFTFQRFEVVPKKSKELIYTKGWHNIIGFHTRNIPHQGHIFIQKEAIKLSNADGLMLSPAVGLKKKGDFKNDFLIESYSEILRSKVHYKKAILCSLDIYSRYAGVREAVFTAICRKNLGCTHFIVGRDHTGFNNNFLNEDPRTFFSKIGDIGINIIFFDTLGFNKKNNKYSFNKNATSLISGSIIRNLIKKKKKIPDYLLNKDLQKIIKKWRKSFFMIKSFKVHNMLAVQNYMSSGSIFLQSLLDGHSNILSTPALYSREIFKIWNNSLSLNKSNLIEFFIESLPWFDPDKTDVDNGLNRLGKKANEIAVIDKKNLQIFYLYY